MDGGTGRHAGGVQPAGERAFRLVPASTLSHDHFSQLPLAICPVCARAMHICEYSVFLRFQSKPLLNVELSVLTFQEGIQPI